MKSKRSPLRSPLLMALLLNALFFGAVLLLFRLNYESNDDQMMLAFQCGAMDGQFSTRVIYLNYALSWALARLAAAAPSAPWYALAEYAATFLSFTAISYAFMRADRRRGLLASLLVLCAFGFDCYTQIQFTKVAGCAAAAGCLLLLDALADRRARVPQALAGLLLAAVGWCYRFRMALPAMAAVGCAALFTAVRQIRAKDWRRLKREAAWLIALAALCGGLKLLDDAAYRVDPAWARYREFNRYRVQLVDLSFPDYDGNAGLYGRLDIAREDVDLYDSWDFSDPERFNLESVRALAEAREPARLDADYWRTLGGEIPYGYLRYAWMPAFLLAAALAVYASRRNIPWLLAALALLAAFSGYLVYYGRYLQKRVDLCVFLGLTLALLTIYLRTADRREPPAIRPCALVASLILLFSLPAFAGYSHDTAHSAEDAAQSRELSDLMCEDREHLYMVSLRSSNIWRDAYGVWEPLPVDCRANVCFIGGCSAYTPVWYNACERQGVVNPFRECIGRDDVYVLDNRHISAIVSYLQRHYDPAAAGLLAKQINGNNFYRIVSGSLRFDAPVRDDRPDDLAVENLVCALEGGQLSVSANLYRPGRSSYLGEAVLELTRSDGDVFRQLMTQREDDRRADDLSGRFSDYRATRPLPDGYTWQAAILYKSEGVWYRACTFPIA